MRCASSRCGNSPTGCVRALASGEPRVNERMTRVDERDEAVGEHRVAFVHVKFHPHWNASLRAWRRQQQRAAMAVRLETTHDREDRVQQRGPLEVRGLARRLHPGRMQPRTDHVHTARQDLADRQELQLGERELILKAAGPERRQLDAAPVDVELTGVSHVDEERVRRGPRREGSAAPRAREVRSDIHDAGNLAGVRGGTHDENGGVVGAHGRGQRTDGVDRKCARLQKRQDRHGAALAVARDSRRQRATERESQLAPFFARKARDERRLEDESQLLEGRQRRRRPIVPRHEGRPARENLAREIGGKRVRHRA